MRRNVQIVWNFAPEGSEPRDSHPVLNFYEYENRQYLCGFPASEAGSSLKVAGQGLRN
jgi:hypothetical protein